MAVSRIRDCDGFTTVGHFRARQSRELKLLLLLLLSSPPSSRNRCLALQTVHLAPRCRCSLAFTKCIHVDRVLMTRPVKRGRRVDVDVKSCSYFSIVTLEHGKWATSRIVTSVGFCERPSQTVSEDVQLAADPFLSPPSLNSLPPPPSPLHTLITHILLFTH